MLSKQQYQVLNACADSPEVFYGPFAMVNYGGQVFRRADGPDCAQYVDQGPWTVRVPGQAITADIAALLTAGLLQCHRILTDGRREPVLTPRTDEFAVYHDYHCLTFDEHVEQFGYGPHEFWVTEAGQNEIRQAHYRAYDRELGWS